MDKKEQITSIVFLVLGIVMIITVIVLASRRKTARKVLVPGQWPDFSKPRGIRNNNPGNLRLSSSQWQGKIPYQDNTDSTIVNGEPVLQRSFEQFTEFKFGVRAMIKLLKNYQSNYGLATVRSIINKWAPPSENNTSSYVTNVSNAVGVHPDAAFPLHKENTRKLVKAMARSENGAQKEWISDSDFDQAWELV